MKILNSEQTRLWDQYTIEHEPVTSIELMERAAQQCANWIETHLPGKESFNIFCGKGNNGGDGLAIARILSQKNYPVTVYILEFGHKGTDDFQTNLARLHQEARSEIRFIQSEENFHPIDDQSVIIDALYGSGLNRKLDGVTANLVNFINQSRALIVSIDIPSGMFVDRSSKDNIVITANHTLTFQCLKPAFLVAENEDLLGDVEVLDIGLHPGFSATTEGAYEWIDETLIHSIIKPRQRFAHKGNFGHGLIVAGSYGKIGAAILSAQGCLRSGVGLLSCHIPGCGYNIIQTSVPEAMVHTDFNSSFLTKIDYDLAPFDAIGVGPGIGQASETKMLLHELFDSFRHPVVIDADALNLLAAQKDLLNLVPPGSILTPHPKEFERLFGSATDDFERIQLALKKSKELNVVIILKGHRSFIATPAVYASAYSYGRGFFNSTGNAGMATGGSGDVLTGILTGLLCQGYSSVEAAILGAYIHGLAGDIAADELSMEGMIAGDIAGSLGAAFKRVMSGMMHAD